MNLIILFTSLKSMYDMCPTHPMILHITFEQSLLRKTKITVSYFNSQYSKFFATSAKDITSKLLDD